MSAESFDKHVAAEAERKEKEALESAACVYICDACHKSFGSEGAFETHIRTKKHVARVKELLAERKAQSEAAKGGVLADGSVPDAAEDAGLPSGASGVTAEARRPLPASGLVGVAESKSREAGDGEDGTTAGAEAELTVSATNCLFCFADGGDIEGCVCRPAVVPLRIQNTANEPTTVSKAHSLDCCPCPFLLTRRSPLSAATCRTCGRCTPSSCLT